MLCLAECSCIAVGYAASPRFGTGTMRTAKGGWAVSVPASRYAVVGPEIAVEDAMLSQHALLINGAEIAAVLPHAQLPSDVPVQHVAGAYLIPGLVDIHIHGAAGIGYDQIEKDPVPHIGAHLLDNGITTDLHTLASPPV